MKEMKERNTVLIVDDCKIILLILHRQKQFEKQNKI